MPGYVEINNEKCYMLLLCLIINDKNVVVNPFVYDQNINKHLDVFTCNKFVSSLLQKIFYF